MKSIKTILLSLTALLCAISITQAQQPTNLCQISGTLVGAKDGEVLSFMNGRQRESAEITNEKFLFTFTLEFPNIINLIPPEGGRTLRLFVQPGEVKITAKAGELANATFEGTGVADWNYYISQTKIYPGTNNRQAIVETIKALPDSPLSGFFLNTYLTAQTDYAMSKELYDGLSEKGKASHYAQLFKATSDKQEALEQTKGAFAPAFSLTDKEGDKVSLSDYKGKYLILDFWGSWCGPCRMSHPHLIELYNKYKDKNFDILGLANEKGTGGEKWLQAIKEDGLPWKQVNLDLNETGKDVLANYNIMAYPTKILMDPNGSILAFYVGGSSAMDDKLKEIFGM